MINFEQINSMTLLLGAASLVVMVASVVFARFKHVAIRQLKQDKKQLESVLKANIQNAAEKNGTIKAQSEEFQALQQSYMKLVTREKSLQKSYETIGKSNTELLEMFKNTQSNYNESQLALIQTQEEIEQLKKSNVRLSQTNHILTKALDNSREEKNYYRSELKTSEKLAQSADSASMLCA